MQIYGIVIMKIVAKNDLTGEYIEGKFQVLNVEFLRDVRISKEQIIESLKVFQFDINHALNLSEESYRIREEVISNNYFSPDTGKLTGVKRNVENYFDVFTKLPFLYLDLQKDGGFQYPYIHSPKGGFAGGHGRTLVNYRYFPEITNDIIHQHSDLGVGGFEVLEEVTDFVSNNRYWKGKDIDVALFGLERFGDVWFIKHIDFVSSDYLSNHANFRPEYFVEMACNVDIWKKQLDAMRKNPEKNLLEIIDLLVLSNLDLAEKNYDWKI